MQSTKNKTTQVLSIYTPLLHYFFSNISFFTKTEQTLQKMQKKKPTYKKIKIKKGKKSTYATFLLSLERDGST